MAADVYRWRRSIVVNYVSLAPEQMIDHAIDRLLVARNDARRQHHGIALLDLRVLMIVHRSPRQRRHGLALGSGNHYANFFRRIILHISRMDQQPLRNFYVSQVFRDFRRAVHRTPDKRDLAAMLEGHLDRQLEAMDGRGETRNKKPPPGMGEYFVELAAYRALTRRVSLSLDVSGILEKCQHALFAIFRERMQVEKSVVRRRGVDFEIPGMNDYAQRGVDSQRNTIYQTMSNLNWMNRERTDLETLSRRDLV